MRTIRIYLGLFSLEQMDFEAVERIAGTHPVNVRKMAKVKDIVKGKEIDIVQDSCDLCVNRYHGQLYVNRIYEKLTKDIHNAKQLGEYCQQNAISINLMIVVEGVNDTYSFPVLDMSAEFISFLSDLHAGICYDFYINDEDYPKLLPGKFYFFRKRCEAFMDNLSSMLKFKSLQK